MPKNIFGGFKKEKKITEPPNTIMEISAPYDFKKRFHVGIDAVSGEISGLPDAWKKFLQESNIT